jgi:3',5'-cyclic AMP phosphodiesterase CpdA
MIRLAHLSDIHITATPLGWQPKDWFSKRLTSWFNHRCLGRGHRFCQAEEVLTLLMRDVKERGVEHILFSGDATALGFENELRRAAELLEVNARSGLAVPGNHDYLTKGAERSGLFERVFAPWQTGLRPAGVHYPPLTTHPVDETYPFAQRLGPAWVIAVNSAVGNFLAFDASGRVGQAQRDRLRRLLAELSPGPRILVTHYPVCLSDGRRGEKTFRGLHDLSEVVKIAAAGGVSVWLHGHRHHAFVLAHCDLAPFPVICVGSATQTNRWSYNECTVEESQLLVSRRSFNPVEKRFGESASFKIPFATCIF